MSLLKLDEISNFYKEKEEKMKDLALPEKIKKLEKYQKIMSDDIASKYRRMLFFAKRFGFSESQVVENEKIYNQMLELADTWRQKLMKLKQEAGILTAETDNREATQVRLNRVNLLYTSKTKPPVWKLSWVVLMSKLIKKLEKTVTINMETLTTPKYLQSVTLDDKNIPLPVKEFALAEGEHHLVLTFKEQNKRDFGNHGILGITNNGIISCKLSWDGKHLYIDDFAEFDSNLVNDFAFTIEEATKDMLADQVATSCSSKLNLL